MTLGEIVATDVVLFCVEIRRRVRGDMSTNNISDAFVQIIMIQ